MKKREMDPGSRIFLFIILIIFAGLSIWLNMGR